MCDNGYKTTVYPPVRRASGEEVNKEMIMELYRTINALEVRIKVLEDDKRGGYQSPQDTVFGGY